MTAADPQELKDARALWLQDRCDGHDLFARFIAPLVRRFRYEEG